MYTDIKPNGTRTVTIEKETLNGLELHIDARDGNGDEVPATLLNKSRVKVTLQRNGYKPLVIVNENLSRALAFYVANTKAQLSMDDGTLKGIVRVIPIMFYGSISLKDGDKILVELDVQTASFPNATVANTSIELHTMDSVGDSGRILQVSSFPFGTAVEQKEFSNIPSDTSKILIASDFGKSNREDNAVIPVDVELTAHGLLNRERKSQMLYHQDLLLERRGIAQHVVAYQGSPISGIKLDVTLSSASSDESVIICGSVVASR